MRLADIWQLCWPDNRCLLCGGRYSDYGGQSKVRLCRACREMLAAYRCCPRCGSFVAAEKPRHICDRLPEGLASGGALLGILAAAPYAGPLRQRLLELKYRGRPQLAKPLGELLAWVWRQAELDFQPDLVVPVPLHRERQQQRGYNQSELLARAFAGHFGLPVAEALLRLRDTGAQHRLSAAERTRNVAGAFALAAAPEEVAGRRVLLLDDIITSGATIHSCTAVLVQAGCAQVYGAAVAGHLYK